MLPRLFINSNIDAIFKDGDFETCIESFFNNYKSSDNLLEKCNELIGIYVINKSKFISENPEKIFSIEKDYFEKITKIKKLYTYKYSGEFLDVGIAEDYKDLTMNKIEDFCPK